jgi:hypothetical protein
MTGVISNRKGFLGDTNKDLNGTQPSYRKDKLISSSGMMFNRNTLKMIGCSG